jgi:transcriptional regulator with PAS, ATPase and Fis domain
MENITYDDLFDNMANSNSNLLILGKAGCGKSHLIKQFTSKRDDIIIVAPSGIAAKNIGGMTIQSYFSIRPFTYTIDNNILKHSMKKKEIIMNCNILLIDEISMIRCEILDIVDKVLRIIKNNSLPFGGMKLLFFGDMCQMEPVVQDKEKNKLNEIYPDCNGDYNFYNAYVMNENNYFNESFNIFQIEEDFRHKDDTVFMKILNTIRFGKITPNSLEILNKQYRDEDFFNEEYQYLTVTKSKAETINDHFMNRITENTYNSAANFTITNSDYTGDVFKIKHQFCLNLKMKVGMKIMFIKNDGYTNGYRWVNGTIGKIKSIICDNNINQVDSVIIEIIGKGDIEVKRVMTILKDNLYEESTEFEEVGTIEQFPIVPAWAICIDKSQGLTLDKIAVVLEIANRPNQVYVALSRAKKLSDIILLGRKIRRSDIFFLKLCLYSLKK